MTLFISSVQVAARATTGTQDFEIPRFGAAKTAVFFLSRATVLNTSTDHGLLMCGFTDGSTNHASVCSVENGVADENANRWTRSVACIQVLDPTVAAGASAGVAVFDSWLPNGVRINWTEAPDDDWLITCVLFGGSDLSAYAGVASVTGSTTLEVTAPGADTDVAFFAMTNATGGAPSGASASHCIGFFANDGTTDHNKCMFWGAQDGAASGVPYAEARDDACILNGFVGSTTARRHAEQITNGFQLVSDASGNLPISYLALNFNGNYKALAGHLDSPGAGAEVITTTGFRARFLAMLGCGLDTIDTRVVSGDASSFAAGVADDSGRYAASKEFCHSLTDEGGAATLNTQSRANTKLIEVPIPVGTEGDVATLTSFAYEATTLDFSSATLDGLYPWLAIEADVIVPNLLNSAYGAEGDGPLVDPESAVGGAYGASGTGVLTEAYG